MENIGEKRIMNKFLLFLTGCISPVLLWAVSLDIETVEKRDFKAGEEIVFTVCAKDDAGKKLVSGSFDLEIKDSGRVLIETRKINLAEKGNPFSFTTRLDRPGFVFVSSPGYVDSDGKKEKWAMKPFYPYGGAAVEPEKIIAGTERPEDFDRFWQEGIKAFESAEVTVEALENIKRDGYKVSRVTVKFPDGSEAITGFLSIPEKPGKYPALAAVPGAGPGSVSPQPYWSSPVPAIELWMNVHLFPTADNAAEQSRRYRKYNESFPGKAYYLHNAGNRDEYIYRKVWLALNRAMDFVAELPEFDGRHFAITGNSQGGGTALAVGSLNKNVTCIVASVAALCDHGGWKMNRMPGWPMLYFNCKKVDVEKSYPYFDGVNFAVNIHVPVLMSAGFVDTTCFPSSVFAAYNKIPSKNKRLYRMYRYGHRTAPEFPAEVREFLAKELTR